MNPENRILVVDDDAGIIDTMRTILEDDGHKVETEFNILTAINRAVNAVPPYRLVICDINMPYTSAPEHNAALDMYNALPDDSPTVVMACSAAGTKKKADTVKVTNGEVLILDKPFNIDDLSALANSVMSASQTVVDVDHTPKQGS